MREAGVGHVLAVEPVTAVGTAMIAAHAVSFFMIVLRRASPATGSSSKMW